MSCFLFVKQFLKTSASRSEEKYLFRTSVSYAISHAISLGRHASYIRILIESAQSVISVVRLTDTDGAMLVARYSVPIFMTPPSDAVNVCCKNYAIMQMQRGD